MYIKCQHLEARKCFRLFSERLLENKVIQTGPKGVLMNLSSLKLVI